MNYNDILKRIAAENNTTEQEVEAEMRRALRIAGLDIEPFDFIMMTASRLKKDDIS